VQKEGGVKREIEENRNADGYVKKGLGKRKLKGGDAALIGEEERRI